MGTEVLRPQDCLSERIRVPPTVCPRRRYGNGTFNPGYYYANNNNDGNVRFIKKPAQKKRIGPEQQVSKKYDSTDDLKTVRNNAMMEKVTILRRGESLDTKIKSIDGIKVVDIKSSVMEKSDLYAGSAFFVSPAPSSLPLPSFSKKKEVPVDELATKGLRRLLQLDL
ncbi:hypothetical protein F3Y22_tig00116958pilonHSYRG00085 [Hibiscus syriacus]|uniref:Uncharacterized protein n=1 Tax=Hibiscus syriacus TaxID=106335 RepID=A0A6A2WL00_HIBSY|nr:hypothetical protein F3Y22_tig00116958pilonHSYRG00085 [Hibiscus syriacus]